MRSEFGRFPDPPRRWGPAGALAGVAAALLFACCAGRPLPAESTAKLDVQGHRGCRGLRPENSLAAFRHALELGVSTLELDLRLTRDRVLVVHHDPRPSPGRCFRAEPPIPPRRFREMDWSDLDGIDCGSRIGARFPRQQAVPGSRILRFEEVLALAAAAATPVHLNVEIKRDEGDPPVELVADLLADAVESYGLEERTTVQSFSPTVLAALRERAPRLRRSALVRRRGDYDRMIRAGGATILSPRFDRLRLADVRRYQERGIAVVPWTVNDRRTIEKLIAWGVDGIISDYPDLVLSIYRRLRPEGRLTPAGTRGSSGASPGDA